jgi:pimeloyl-ACP methyl ester carboxylesterase
MGSMMPRTESQIVLLPGLGADERLFAAQLRAFPDLLTPRWLSPDPHDSLAGYAARMAAEVPSVRPLVLGGCSFGGMVACEMASILRPDALVLIGSAGSRSEIPWYLRTLAPLAQIIPSAGFKMSKILAPALGYLVGGREVAHRHLFVEMLRETSSTFLHWACTAVASWRPTPRPGVRVIVIHGSEDRVLPLGRRVVDVVIQRAGHLLAVTHAREVNEALAEMVDRVAGAEEA